MFAIDVQVTELFSNESIPLKDMPNIWVGWNTHEDRRRLQTNADDLNHDQTFYVAHLKYASHWSKTEASHL